MNKARILLVDDDPLILKSIGPALEECGYCTDTAPNGDAAIGRLQEGAYELVITDLVMEDTDGIAVLRHAKRLNPETMVIILTGHGDMTSAIDALRLDADDYILKPCEEEEIFFRVKRCLEKLELMRKLKAYENILPVCCVCGKIRDDAGREPGTGDWLRVEKFIWKRSSIEVTSTYCPECLAKVEQAALDGL